MSSLNSRNNDIIICRFNNSLSITYSKSESNIINGKKVKYVTESFQNIIESHFKNRPNDVIHVNHNVSFNHIENHPGTQAKAKWAMEYMKAIRGDVKNFSERLVAFSCVEGIMFSSSFCALFWLKNRGLCPGLTFSNELISRDEALHRDFAIAMYKECPKLPRKNILHIVESAVETELIFVRNSLPDNLKGMNYDMMAQYVKFVADHLLNSLGYNKLYKVKNPFPFMDMISLEGKTNFFERRVGEYSRPTTMSFGLDDTF